MQEIIFLMALGVVINESV